MIDHRSRDVLLAEIRAWHDEGIITTDQRDLLSRRYQSLPDTPVEEAEAAEARLSGAMLVLLAIGGGLVVLGVAFLAIEYWRDIPSAMRMFLTWGLFGGFAAWATAVHFGQQSSRSGAALATIAGALLPLALGVTWEEQNLHDLDEYGILFTSILGVVYLSGAIALRSIALGILTTVALVALSFELILGYFELDASPAIACFLVAGSLLTLAAWLTGRSPWSFLTPGLASGGLCMVVVTSFVGTFDLGRDYPEGMRAFSYVLLFAIPVTASVIGVRQGLLLLLLSGVATLWIAMIRLFADLLQDMLAVTAAAIILGVLIIVGALHWEGRRRKAERERQGGVSS